MLKANPKGGFFVSERKETQVIHIRLSGECMERRKLVPSRGFGTFLPVNGYRKRPPEKHNAGCFVWRDA